MMDGISSVHVYFENGIRIREKIKLVVAFWKPNEI